MCGNTVYDSKESYPLYLTEIENQLVIERQISYAKEIEPRTYFFCIKKEDIERFQVDSVIRQLIPEPKIISIHSVTKGAICTALLGCEHVNLEYILDILLYVFFLIQLK